MVIGKSFPATSGVGHTVWAEAEAAFFWPSLLPTVTTRLAYTVLPTSQLWSQQCWLDAAWGFTPWFHLSLAYRAQKPIVARELWPFSQTICLLKIPSSKGLIDTHIHFGSSGNIWPKGLFLSWLILPPAINLTFLPNCAEVPLSNICYLFRWSPHSAFFSSCSPHNLLRKDPSSPFWSSEETVRALCWWHSHPLSASSSSRLHGTSHAFYLAFKGPKVPRKVLAAAAQPLPCPRPTSVLTLMQVASRMHWDARTLKVGLDLRRHWPWRHILTVQRGRTVWANPTLSQPLSSLFLFPDLNQCLFFLLLSSMVSGSLLLSLFHSPPQLSPPFICLGLLESALKEPSSTLLGPLRL